MSREWNPLLWGFYARQIENGGNHVNDMTECFVSLQVAKSVLANEQ